MENPGFDIWVGWYGLNSWFYWLKLTRSEIPSKTTSAMRITYIKFQVTSIAEMMFGSQYLFNCTDFHWTSLDPPNYHRKITSHSLKMVGILVSGVGCYGLQNITQTNPRCLLYTYLYFNFICVMVSYASLSTRVPPPQYKSSTNLKWLKLDFSIGRHQSWRMSAKIPRPLCADWSLNLLFLWKSHHEDHYRGRRISAFPVTVMQLQYLYMTW